MEHLIVAAEVIESKRQETALDPPLVKKKVFVDMRIFATFEAMILFPEIMPHFHLR
jgi:hypothetical protein